jgi:hypothetical protein
VRGFSLKVSGHGLITQHNTVVGWKHKFEDSGCVSNLTPGAPITANIEEKGIKEGSPCKAVHIFLVDKYIMS